ncbi:hypothetical protein BDV33DRAFT_210814 [Aspergillus novoparasiticus]|uniref:Zn(2)-C6 fungal-type domain-containing protein n=1 Tax=Aspergillus novoparasiticus TaxID=986946 RepID=A0A5N6E8T4_9EURO|nr:hypothetical protein BDV33DRAFT_210814 [Aspergillus novoparasiticus]
MATPVSPTHPNTSRRLPRVPRMHYSAQQNPAYFPKHDLPQPPPNGLCRGQRNIPKRTAEAHLPLSSFLNGELQPAPDDALAGHRPQRWKTPQVPRNNVSIPLPLPLSSSAPNPNPIPPFSYTPAPYNSGYHSQRKAARAQLACEQCRAKKAKCDEGQPSCSHCKENNANCTYKVTPHKQDKATQIVLYQLQSFQETMMERFNRLDQQSTEHGNNFNSILAKIHAKSAPKEPGKPAVPPLAKDIIHASTSKDEIIATMQKPIPEPTETVTEQVASSGGGGELSISTDHTTAAHNLLLWPSIRDLLRPRECHDDYVKIIEEGRGLIRVYGRGEGDETSEGNGLSPPPMALSTNFDENQPYNATLSPSGHWGPYVNQPQIKLDNVGLDENGMLTADPDMVRSYHRSYIKHMHHLHPFLDQNELDKRVESFIKTYSPLKGPMLSSGAPDIHNVPRGRKRKRLCQSSHGVGCNMQSTAQQSSCRHIEPSIYNAIILLVLALGSICEANLVPGPLTDDVIDFRKQVIPGPPTHDLLSRADSDSQTQDSGYIADSHTFASPSVTDSRQSSVDRQPTIQEKNLDYIPGLAFYAYATQILGMLQGANTLPHAQAALLAGLYADQLATPIQSYGWIRQAARICEVVIRPKSYDLITDRRLKDLHNFVYWTCLQLVSDTPAELDLPNSGISRSVARISLPSGRFSLGHPNEVSGPGTLMMFYYSAQIHLGKILTRVHTHLYKVGKQGQTHSLHLQQALSANLERWRNSLPAVMEWKDTDPPSEDINVARLRAKYYSVRYIIHRPLLYHVLHNYGHFGLRTSSSGPPSDMGTTYRSASVPHGELPTKLRNACKVCVDSAILSTVAFDGIKGRPVMTNIFGTSHAQFGNMLVLSAAYMSNISELVDRDELERLLKRTINFLLQSRYISPTLRADARILTEIYEKIFGNSHRGRI